MSLNCNHQMIYWRVEDSRYLATTKWMNYTKLAVLGSCKCLLTYDIRLRESWEFVIQSVDIFFFFWNFSKDRNDWSIICRLFSLISDPEPLKIFIWSSNHFQVFMNILTWKMRNDELMDWKASNVKQEKSCWKLSSITWRLSPTKYLWVVSLSRWFLSSSRCDAINFIDLQGKVT